jgi:hypothetical protein
MPVLCEWGFHFCRIPATCDNYYPLDENPRHAKIQAWDVIEEDNGDKSVCRKIIILEEITPDQWGHMTGIFTDRSQTVYLSNGQFHREDGPAVEWSNGTKIWYRNGQLHREDGGPATEYPDGYKAWYRNGQYHREGGPAIENQYGGKSWYRNGQPHREDGPALEHASGHKEWYRNGQFIRCEEADSSSDIHRDM